MGGDFRSVSWVCDSKFAGIGRDGSVAGRRDGSGGVLVGVDAAIREGEGTHC